MLSEGTVFLTEQQEDCGIIQELGKTVKVLVEGKKLFSRMQKTLLSCDTYH